MAIVITSCSIYERKGHGEPIAFPHVLEGDLPPETFVWIDMTEPLATDFGRFVGEYALHELAVEDAVEAGQRPKVERYGSTLVAVLRPVRREDGGSIAYDELFIAIGDRFVVTVSHGPLDALLDEAKRRMGDTAGIENRPSTALYALADVVVDDYVRLLDTEERTIELVETSVFTERPPSHVGRDLFHHKREVLQLWQAAAPLVHPLEELIDDRKGLVDEDIREYMRDVADHLKSVVARLETHRDLLTDAFDVNVAQVGVKQNEDLRKMSAWAALLLLPTLLVGLWGMNFTHMPELDEPWGYPAALGSIGVSCLALYLWFRKAEWL